MSLKERIELFKASRNRPADIESILANAVEELRAAGTAAGLTVGERAPDFALPNQGGGNGPVERAARQGPGRSLLLPWRLVTVLQPGAGSSGEGIARDPVPRRRPDGGQPGTPG
jgi:hypothetical protein